MVPQIREGLQNVAEIGLAPGAMAAGPSLYNVSTPPPPKKKIQSFYPGLKIAIFRPPPTNIVA